MTSNETQEPEQPTIEEVLAHALKKVNYFMSGWIREGRLHPEHAEEIRQEALVRALEAYPSIVADRGWRSLIQINAHGAMVDYFRAGDGFSERAVSLREKKKKKKRATGSGVSNEVEKKEPARNTGFRPKPLTRRIPNRDANGKDCPVEKILDGLLGAPEPADEDDSLDKYLRIFRRIKPVWPLVARLAQHPALDRKLRDAVHLVAKAWRGSSQQSLDGKFGVGRRRLGQIMRDFFNWLDPVDEVSPERDRQLDQIIYAFDLGQIYGVETHDNGFGWDGEPIDLSDAESVESSRDHVVPWLLKVAPPDPTAQDPLEEERKRLAEQHAERPPARYEAAADPGEQLDLLSIPSNPGFGPTYH